MAQRVQVTIPRDSGLPGDESVNTFHFRTGTGGVFTSGQADAVTEGLRKFYFDVAPGAASRVATYLGSVSAVPFQVAFYDLTVPPPRVPYQERTITGTLGGANQAEEVAICLSFQATPVSGQAQRNRRGRIFLGPVTQTAAELSNGRTRVLAAARDNITKAAKELQLHIRNIGVNFDWIVWSPTTLQEHVISEAWVDDAFDTVRSRGPKPTTRTSITF